MIRNDEVSRFTMNAGEGIVTFLVLGALNHEAPIQRNTLAHNGSICAGITSSSSSLAHLASPACIAVVDRRGYRYLGDTVDVLV